MKSSKAKATKKSVGHPPHEPTEENRKLVSFAIAIGGTEPAIAEFIGISDNTLRKYYRKELDIGLFRFTMALAKKGYQTAMGDGPQAAAWGMFFLKTRAGWREVTRQEQTGEGGGPIKWIVGWEK